MRSLSLKSSVGTGPLLVAALTPWFLVDLATIGPTGAALFVVCLLVTAALGGGVLWLLRPTSPSQAILLALPSGFLVATAGAGLAASTRQVPASAIIFTLVMVSALGLPVIAAALRRSWSAPVTGSWAWVVASCAVCAVVFVPAALRDLRLMPDGAFQWIYVDSEWFLALAGQVPRSGPIAIDLPGVAGVPLHYHFGPYVIAGALSAVSKLSVADALARIVRPIGDLSLAAAAIGFGRALGRRRGSPALAGAAALLGAIATGSLTWMFAKTNNPTAATPHALLVALPSVPGDCNPCSELMVGHSILWGSIGLFLVLAFLADRELRPRTDARPLLPALVLATNGVAGLAAMGATASAFVVSRWLRREETNWRMVARLGAMALGCALVFAGMRYGGSAGSFLRIDRDPSRNWASFWSVLVLGFGLRLYALRWIRDREDLEITLPLVATFLGLLAFTFFLEDGLAGNDEYGRLFAEPLAGAAAASLLALDFVRGWAFVVAEVVALARWVGASCTVFGLGMLALDAAHGRVHAKSLMATVASALVWWLARRSATARPNALARLALGSVIVVQSVAFVSPLVDIGLDRSGFAVRTSSGEVADLRRLRDALPAAALVATNHRELRRGGLSRPWQFDYGALLQHPVHLEGSFYAGGTVQLSQRTEENRRLFETKDPTEVRSIVVNNGIRALVLEPGTSLGVSLLPPWLEPVRGLGTLKAYLVRLD